MVADIDESYSIGDTQGSAPQKRFFGTTLRRLKIAGLVLACAAVLSAAGYGAYKGAMAGHDYIIRQKQLEEQSLESVVCRPVSVDSIDSRFISGIISFTATFQTADGRELHARSYVNTRGVAQRALCDVTKELADSGQVVLKGHKRFDGNQYIFVFSKLNGETYRHDFVN